ncbi:hypothetical protein R1flu_027690 [Riccia fluitans]|uniref:Uncharacterized protein n=1 Tax=Riccia fluitans TaxID=41844 RepID=A0ABD1XJJ8_9MARC
MKADTLEGLCEAVAKGMELDELRALDPSGRCAGDYALENEHQDAIEALHNAGVRAKLIFGAVERLCREKGDAKDKVCLEERAKFSEGRLMDEESNAVLMAWENPLKAVHAKVICWGEMPNVRVICGRWQDVLPQLGTYDGILLTRLGSVMRT